MVNIEVKLENTWEKMDCIGEKQGNIWESLESSLVKLVNNLDLLGNS